MKRIIHSYVSKHCRLIRLLDNIGLMLTCKCGGDRRIKLLSTPWWGAFA
jgi:hypothetical protein